MDSGTDGAIKSDGDTPSITIAILRTHSDRHVTSIPLLLIVAGTVGFLHSILPDHWVPLVARRIAAIAVPFGAAASPDLTILPVFLAASAIGVGAVIGVLTTFSIVTLATFVALTVGATLAGYQVQGEWLEENGNTLTAIVLIVIGIAV